MTEQHGEHRPLIWLASYPKSGNTWLRLLLKSALTDPAQASIDLQAMGNELIASSRELVQRLTGFNASELSDVEADGLRSLAVQRLATQSPADVLLKVHDRFDAAGLGGSQFPAQQTRAVIYLVRNPLDVAPSLAHHLGLSIDRAVEVMGNSEACLGGGSRGDPEQFRQPLGSWSEHVASWLTQSRVPVTLLRYEDLSTAPQDSLRRVLTALGWSQPSEAHLQQAIDRCRIDRLQTVEARTGYGDRSPTGRPFFRSGRVGGWRESLKDEAIQSVLRAHGAWMQQLGYGRN